VPPQLSGGDPGGVRHSPRAELGASSALSSSSSLQDAVLNACYRGCRLFSICHFVDASAELNTTRAECEAGEEPSAERPPDPKHPPGGVPRLLPAPPEHPASAQPPAVPRGRVGTLLQTERGADLHPLGVSQGGLGGSWEVLGRRAHRGDRAPPNFAPPPASQRAPKPTATRRSSLAA